MSEHPPAKAREQASLERQIMDPGIAKNDAEWWAMGEIERLRKALQSESRRAEEYNGKHQWACLELEILRGTSKEANARFRPMEIAAALVDAWRRDFPGRKIYSDASLGELTRRIAAAMVGDPVTINCLDCGEPFVHVANSGDKWRCDPCRRQY